MTRSNVRQLLVASLWAAMLLAGVFQGGPTQAAIFTVNSTADAVDASPGDAVCETAPGDGVCTLRAAIQEANALPGTDVITLPAGLYVLTIQGSFPNFGDDAAAFGNLQAAAAVAPVRPRLSAGVHPAGRVSIPLPARKREFAIPPENESRTSKDPIGYIEIA